MPPHLGISVRGVIDIRWGRFGFRIAGSDVLTRLSQLVNVIYQDQQTGIIDYTTGHSIPEIKHALLKLRTRVCNASCTKSQGHTDLS
jgi:hypothetical protein